ncbi:hypothetical protein ABPG73_021183 [Tetrahymena malaccensis]
MDPNNFFQICLINNCDAQQTDQVYSNDLMTCLQSYDECYDFVGDLSNSCNVNNCIVDCFDLFPQDSQECYSQCIDQQQSYIQQSCQSQDTEMYSLDSNYTDNASSSSSKNNGYSSNNNSTNTVNQDNFMNPVQQNSEDSDKSLWIAIYCLIAAVILLIFIIIAYFIIKKRRNNTKTNLKSTDQQQDNKQQQQQQQEIVPPIQSIVIGIAIQENSYQAQKDQNNQINNEENKTMNKDQCIVIHLDNEVKFQLNDSAKSEISTKNKQPQKQIQSTAISTQIDYQKGLITQQEKQFNIVENEINNANLNVNDQDIINFANDEDDE